MPRGAERDVLKVELAEHLVVGRHFALTLETPDCHGVLVILSGREDLRLPGRDRGVAVDQAGKDTTKGFDTKRQRGYVKQKNVFDVTLQNTTLNRGTKCNNFVRVHTFVRIPAEELGHFLDHFRHPGHTTDQNHLIDVGSGQARILQRGGAGLHGVLDQVTDEAFQLRTGQLHNHVQRLAGGGVH